MELLDIVSLNKKDYVVSKMVIWDNKDYVLLEEINNDDRLVNNRFIGRLGVKNGEDVIAIVEDKDAEEYKNVSRLFWEMK